MRHLLLLTFGLVAVLPGTAEPAAKADLNSASTTQLEAVPGIGPTTAKRIVRLRERNGPFRCIEELRAVPRLTEAQLEALRERAFVANPDPRCKQQDILRRRGKPLRPRRSQ